MAEESMQMSQQRPLQEKSAILASLDGTKDVNTICLNLMGLQEREEYKDGRTVKVFVRISKQTFTHEFITTHFKPQYSQLINYTVQASKEMKEIIPMQVFMFARNLTDLFVTHGDDHYISDESYNKIILLHNKKIEEIGPDGKKRFVSSWNCSSNSHKNVSWDYNQPITYQMLQMVKNQEEEVDQGIVIKSIVIPSVIFVQRSLNKAWSSEFKPGMLIEMLSETYKESATVKEVEQKQNSGVLGRFMGGKTEVTNK